MAHQLETLATCQCGLMWASSPSQSAMFHGFLQAALLPWRAHPIGAGLMKLGVVPSAAAVSCSCLPESFFAWLRPVCVMWASTPCQLCGPASPRQLWRNAVCLRRSLNMDGHRYCLRRYRPLRETRPTATFGNAFDFEAVLMKYLQRDHLQCATPACTAPPRHTCPLTLQRA